MRRGATLHPKRGIIEVSQEKGSSNDVCKDNSGYV